MVIRHSIKELLAKSMVMRPMKCIVEHFKFKFWDKKKNKLKIKMQLYSFSKYECIFCNDTALVMVLS